MLPTLWYTQLKTQLIQALHHSTLPNEDLREYLGRLQKDVIAALYDAT